MAALPPRYREVLLKYYSGCSAAGIASFLGATPETEGPYTLHLSTGGGPDRETVFKIAENLEW